MAAVSFLFSIVGAEHKVGSGSTINGMACGCLDMRFPLLVGLVEKSRAVVTTERKCWRRCLVAVTR